MHIYQNKTKCKCTQRLKQRSVTKQLLQLNTEVCSVTSKPSQSSSRSVSSFKDASALHHNLHHQQCASDQRDYTFMRIICQIYGTPYFFVFISLYIYICIIYIIYLYITYIYLSIYLSVYIHIYIYSIYVVYIYIYTYIYIYIDVYILLRKIILDFWNCVNLCENSSIQHFVIPIPGLSTNIQLSYRVI